MWISEFSVKRPVSAGVFNAILVIIGLLAINNIPTREYPDVDPSQISVSTTYRGASAQIVERKITKVLEDELAGISGIQKINSTSRDGGSSIRIEFSSNRNPDDAANDVRDIIQKTASKLPRESNPPRVLKSNSNADTILYISLLSDQRSLIDLTDYAERNLVDRFSTIDGVSTINISGKRTPAMRVWLDREALAARRLTVQDIETALKRDNVELPAGTLESETRLFSLRTNTQLNSPEEFESIVIQSGSYGNIIRLKDVADVRFMAEDDRLFARTNLVAGITLGVIPQSKANILAVAKDAKLRMNQIIPSLPNDMSMDVNIDYSEFIEESISEVVSALLISISIVLFVIFFFVGSGRATLIPALTIPIAIIASFFVMSLLGFSLNTLTLLGFVLAIGLVVDDSIVVLENIIRRLEMGEKPIIAAINGSREIGFAVISTTIVLVVTILPISFIPGEIGKIFNEFGISLITTIILSTFVALTLAPMMMSLMFKKSIERGSRCPSEKIDIYFTLKDWSYRFIMFFDNKVADLYEKTLKKVIDKPLIMIGIIPLALLITFSIFKSLPQEYAPTEDRGIVIVRIAGPEGSTTEYMDEQVRYVESIAKFELDNGNARRILARAGGWGVGDQINQAFIFLPLTSWSERDDSSVDIANRIRRKAASIPGIETRVFVPPSLNNFGGFSRPLQIVLGGSDYIELSRYQDQIINRAKENRQIFGLTGDYYERKPTIKISLQKEKAADLGISIEDVASTLEIMLGSKEVTRYIERGEEYKVILQGSAEDRNTPSDLENIYIRSKASDSLIPLASIVKLEESAGPPDLKRLDRMRSITISGSIAEDYSLGDAIEYMQMISTEIIPEDVRLSYDGETRRYIESENSILWTLALAFLLIFLVLAAQFESLLSPIVIMVTVPLALMGGLLGLLVVGSTLNIYSQIGAILLIGLAAKNGVLIVEFTNQLRDQGYEFKESIISASKIRLRPVIMTSLCTAGGAIPLLMATGAGEVSRETLGAVIFFGVVISVFLTLFVVPITYSLIGKNTGSPKRVARLIAAMETDKN